MLLQWKQTLYVLVFHYVKIRAEVKMEKFYRQPSKFILMPYFYSCWVWARSQLGMKYIGNQLKSSFLAGNPAWLKIRPLFALKFLIRLSIQRIVARIKSTLFCSMKIEENEEKVPLLLKQFFECFWRGNGKLGNWVSLRSESSKKHNNPKSVCYWFQGRASSAALPHRHHSGHKFSKFCKNT